MTATVASLPHLRMTRETSLYLDLVRFLAAMTVFIGHVSGQRFTGGLFWPVGAYMGQAVALFFVLSGYVIAYATDTRETSAAAYAVSRAARILSVALPALLATFALDAAGRAIRPDLYSAAWGYVADGRAGQFLANLVFVNQIWFLDVPPGSALPYWSLGYEVWYYVIFGVFVFSRDRLVLLPALLLLVGPKVAAMLPLWLIGVACCRLGRRPRSEETGAALWAGSLLLWLAYEALARRHGRLPPLAPSRWLLPELAEDYVVGVLFAVNLLGFMAISHRFAAPLGAVARPIRWAAGATFTLYLFHLPLAQFLTTLVPWPPQAWATRVVILGGTLGGVFLIAEVTERRKDVWRRGITRLLPRAVRPATR